jgi:hypothetical protein
MGAVEIWLKGGEAMVVPTSLSSFAETSLSSADGGGVVVDSTSSLMAGDETTLFIGATGSSSSSSSSSVAYSASTAMPHEQRAMSVYTTLALCSY